MSTDSELNLWTTGTTGSCLLSLGNLHVLIVMPISRTLLTSTCHKRCTCQDMIILELFSYFENSCVQAIEVQIFKTSSKVYRMKIHERSVSVSTGPRTATAIESQFKGITQLLSSKHTRILARTFTSMVRVILMKYNFQGKLACLSCDLMSSLLVLYIGMIAVQ